MLKGLKVIVPMSLILDIQVLVSQCIADMQYIDMFKKEIVQSVPPFLTHQCDLMAKILSERKRSAMNIINITRQFLKDEAIHLETLTASHLTTVECSVNSKYQGYFNICSNDGPYFILSTMEAGPLPFLKSLVGLDPAPTKSSVYVGVRV